MRIMIAAAALLTGSTAAFAQQSAQDVLAGLGIKVVQPMSSAELVRTRSRVAAELSRAGAASLFQDISNEHGGRARHRPSGLICPLGKKSQRVLAATPHSASCETITDGAVHRVSVERASPGASLEAIAASAVATARREPGFEPFSGLSITGRPGPGTGAVEHRTIRYASRASGRKRAVRVQVGLVGGWVLTERRETKDRAHPGDMAEILSEATFGLSMKPD